MTQPILFANLKKGIDQGPSISFLNILTKTKVSENHNVDHTILGFSRVAEELDFLLLDEKHRKAALKGKKLAQKICQLLNWHTFCTLTPTDDFEARKSVPFVYCGTTAVLGGPPFEGRARDIEGLSWYQDLQFNFSTNLTIPASPIFVSSQTLHFSCPTLKVEDAALTTMGQTQYDNVEIISGMCLFNAQILENALSACGGVDVWRLDSHQATLYEMEYIARASSAIADLASTILSKGKNWYLRADGLHESIRIHLDVPSFHYYHSIHEKLQDGICNFSDALEWVRAIDRRCDQLSRVFEKSVRQEILRRGISTKTSYEIQLSTKNNVVASAIRRALDHGNIPCFDGVMDELKRQDDPLWHSFIGLLPKKEVPHDFRSLGYSFYVFEALRPALAKEIEPTNNSKARPRLLLLSVDDAAERRIYSRSQKLLKKLRQCGTFFFNPTLVEVYMSRRIFINNNIAGSNLYLDDPTPEKPRLVSTNSSPQPKLQSGNTTFEQLESIDVIRMLYGSDCAWNIQRLLAEVGL